MIKNIAITTLLIVCLGTGFYVLEQHKRISALEDQLAATESATSKTTRSDPGDGPATASTGGAITPDASADTKSSRTGDPDGDPESSPRMMRGFSKIMDNPAMNKMIEAQQKATIDVLYEEFVDGLNLTPKERKHFMTLLLAKQMKRVEFGLKMMGGITPDQQATLMEEVGANDEYIKGEIEYFLNNKEDLEAFDYYEKSTNERTAVGGLAAKLEDSDHSLGDDLKDDLTRIMFEERKNAEFTVEFSEEDGDLQKFTSANIDTYTKELGTVNDSIINRASTLLSEDQMKEFSTTLDENVGMIRAQLEMAGSMFGTLDGDGQ